MRKLIIVVSFLLNIALGLMVLTQSLAAPDADLDRSVDQSRAAIKIAEGWRQVAKSWEANSNRFEKIANDLLLATREWKRKAEETKESLDVCNSKEKRL